MRLPEKWVLESRCSDKCMACLADLALPCAPYQNRSAISTRLVLLPLSVGTVFLARERWAPEEKHATSGSLQSTGIAGEEAHIAAPPVIYEGGAKRNISCVHLSGVPGP
jgi:hypothetical protein